MLLQKSKGDFALVIWGEQVKGATPVTVRFGKTWDHAAIYDPTQGVTPVEERRQIDSLPLTLSDHPLIISLPQ